MPAQRASNDPLNVNWAIRFGLSQGWSSDSSQQHVRTLGFNLSPTCELYYQVRTKSGKSSDSSQQHARTGGVKLSVTCELDYLRIGLSQVRM